MERALGAAAGLGRWLMFVAVLFNAGVFQMWRRHSATTAHRALPLCKWSVLGMPWDTVRSNAASAVCAGVVKPALGAAAELGRWFVEGAV